jgi:hypothetical protein
MLLALRTGRLYPRPPPVPPADTRVLIFGSGGVDPRALVRPQGLCQ